MENIANNREIIPPERCTAHHLGMWKKEKKLWQWFSKLIWPWSQKVSGSLKFILPSLSVPFLLFLKRVNEMDGNQAAVSELLEIQETILTLDKERNEEWFQAISKRINALRIKGWARKRKTRRHSRLSNKKKTRKGNKKQRVKTRKGRKGRKCRKTRKH